MPDRQPWPSRLAGGVEDRVQGRELVDADVAALYRLELIDQGELPAGKLYRTPCHRECQPALGKARVVTRSLSTSRNGLTDVAHAQRGESVPVAQARIRVEQGA